MFAKILDWTELKLSPKEVYLEMGYGDVPPDERTVSGVEDMLAKAKLEVVPRYCYTVVKGYLKGGELQIGNHSFRLGRIISRQLAGADAFAVFLATAGLEYEQWRKGADLLDAYWADVIGSVVVERCADRMEEALQASIDKLGWRRTNRFSPGYCEWHVAEQQWLLPMLGTPNPCGVKLTEGKLMWPVKSVSGIIGLGDNVSYQEYKCHHCQLTSCYKRKH